jgi:hypothetical protein
VWKSLLHNELTRSESLTLLVQLKHVSHLSMFIFNIIFTCYVLFRFFFPFSLVIYFRYSVFSFFLLWNKAFHILHIITHDIPFVFLLNSFRCVWPMQSFLEGRNVYTVKPIFKSYMYGCTCARIQSQGAVSSLCRVKIKYLFVSIFSWSIFLNFAFLHGCYLEIIALLMMLLLMPQSFSWEQAVLLFFLLLSLALI